MAGVGKTHARVQQRIGNVHQQVDQDEHGHHDHQVGDDDGPVQHIDGVDQQLAHARPGEDGFGDHGKGDHRAELQGDHGDNRDKDVFQDVHADNARVAQALGAGEFDVVHQQRLLGAGARQADDQRDIEQGKGHPWQQQVAQPVDGEETDRHPEQGNGGAAPVRGQPAQEHREDHDQHQPDPEGGQGKAEDGAGHDGPAGK